MTLLFISFFAGLITVLTPCILPLLPVIVGGSLSSGVVSKRKACIVIVSLGVSVLAFTFLLKVSTLFINVPEFVWTSISGGIIIIFGTITLFPYMWESALLIKSNVKVNALLGKGFKNDSTLGHVLIGAALGPCFSTCSPTYFIVLATVLPVSLFVGSLYMVAYVVGLCLSLGIVVFLSGRLFKKLGILTNPSGYFKKSVGVIFILIGVMILLGGDKKVESLLKVDGIFNSTKIEQRLLELSNSKKEIPRIDEDIQISSQNDAPAQEVVMPREEVTPINNAQKIVTEQTEKKNFQNLTRAAEISTPDGFINTSGKPITIGELRNKKVVLVSFWTYSCINCKRTLPYFNDWYTKYKDQGLEIVSIHTPEFSFEHVLKNVESAVATHKIEYPVVLDNDYSTWSSYGNQYWPRRYLVNKDGFIIYDHIGEGDYEDTEKRIKIALEELNRQ